MQRLASVILALANLSVYDEQESFQHTKRCSDGEYRSPISLDNVHNTMLLMKRLHKSNCHFRVRGASL